MNRSKFAKFIDNVALAFIVFVFGFLFFRKYIKSIIVCLSVSVLLSLFFINLFLKIQNKKYTKLGIEKQELKDIEKLNFKLRSLSKIKQTSFIKNVFQDQILKNKNRFIILKNKVAIVNALDKDILQSQDIFSILAKHDFLKREDLKEVAIICNDVDKTAHEVKQKSGFKDITFVTPEIFYSILKRLDILPKEEIEKTQIKPVRHAISRSFARKNAKYFFRCGLFLCIISLFIPFAKYYLISGCISLFLCSICLIFGFKELQTQPSLLLECCKQEEPNINYKHF